MGQKGDMGRDGYDGLKGRKGGKGDGGLPGIDGPRGLQGPVGLPGVSWGTFALGDNYGATNSVQYVNSSKILCYPTTIRSTVYCK